MKTDNIKQKLIQNMNKNYNNISIRFNIITAVSPN